MNLGELVVQARTRAGMSMQDVADSAGISKAHIYDIEHSRSVNISLKTAIRLSLCLSVPINMMAAAVLEDLKNDKKD